MRVKVGRRVLGLVACGTLLLAGTRVAYGIVADSGAVPPVAAPILNVALGSPGPVTLSGAGSLDYSPDTHIAVVPASGEPQGGHLEAYIVANGFTYRFTGSSMATLSASSPNPVLSPGNFLFDQDYAGMSTVLHLPGTPPADRVGLYHGEQHCPMMAPFNVRVGIGLATSTDYGKEWTPIGQVISGDAPDDPCACPRSYCFTGAGNPSAVIAGGFMYVYYTDWSARLNRADAIHVARVPLLQATQPAAYTKLTSQGWVPAMRTFTQTSIASIPVIIPVNNRPNKSDSDVFTGDASVSPNTYLSTGGQTTYLALVETNLGFATSTSTNLVTWTPPSLVYRFAVHYIDQQPGDSWASYPTLLEDDATAADHYGQPVTGPSNFLYYASGVVGTPHHLVRQWAAIGLPPLLQVHQLHDPRPTNSAPPTFQLTPSSSPFTWVCTDDFQVSLPDGSTQNLYDGVGSHGNVLVLRSGDEATVVTAPYGGACRPTYPSDANAAIDRAVSYDTLLNGCGGGCAQARITEIDSTGRIVASYTRP